MSKDIEQLTAKVAKQQKALADADEALKSAAAYVEKTQPELDAFNVFQDNFLKRAHQVAGALADRGVIERHEVGALVDKLAEDPLRALDLVEKVASYVQPDSLGKTAEDVQSARYVTENLDPFQKLALFGDSRADVRAASSGLVE